MSEISMPPFESIRRAALSMTDPHLQSQLFAELAQSQLTLGQYKAALKTFAEIPLPQEQRTALLTANFSLLPMEKIAPLVQLLQSHPQTQSLAGSLALTLLFAQKYQIAWKLIETAKIPFESDSQRYDFLQNILLHAETVNWTKVLWLHKTFTDTIYVDWATLALVKYLVRQKRLEEAESFADSFVLPIRQSWAYWEMCQLLPEEQSATFLDKAIETIETADVDIDNEEKREMLAVQLRILGRAAFQRGKQELGEQLLERCESILAGLAMPMQRYRQQCFLGKVLCELNIISSVQDYVPVESILSSPLSNMDSGQVLVWLAEAGWKEGWQRAVEVLSVSERGIMESERAEQITAVLRRSISQYQGLEASGDSSENSYRLSGEEFERYYFSPFSIGDCGC